METISSFFGLVCTFIVNILYENSLTNYLFSFDLNKKLIKIKNSGKGPKYQLYDIKKEDEEQQKNERNTNLNLNMNMKNNALDDKFTNISINSNSENNFNIKGKNIEPNSNLTFKKRKKKKTVDKTESEKSISIYNSKKKNEIDIIKEDNKEDNIDFNNANIDDTDNNRLIVDQIHLNKLLVHFCFCCIRSRNNYQNILLDESRLLIAEKLDIINIFKKMCISEEVQYKYNLSKDKIQMSDECKNALGRIIFK